MFLSLHHNGTPYQVKSIDGDVSKTFSLDEIDGPRRLSNMVDADIEREVEGWGGVP